MKPILNLCVEHNVYEGEHVKRRISRDYQIASCVVEPYDEGTTAKKDHPCLTIMFDIKDEALRFVRQNEPNNGVEDNLEITDKVWFVHFWYVPAATSVCVSISTRPHVPYPLACWCGRNHRGEDVSTLQHN